MSKKQAYIVTVANQKGGSGKSTVVVNLAIKLSNLGGKVLVMDTDPQKSEECFVKTRQSKKLPHFTLSNCAGDIAQSLKSSIKLYDFIIIDTGGIDSQDSRKAMLYADAIILPSTASSFDAAVLDTMLATIKEIKDLNKEVKICILMNKISTNVFLDRDLADYKKGVKSLQDGLNLQEDFYLLNSVLRERIAYRRAIAEGVGITEHSDIKARGEFEEFFAEFADCVNLLSNSKKNKV